MNIPAHALNDLASRRVRGTVANEIGFFMRPGAREGDAMAFAKWSRVIRIRKVTPEAIATKL
jgi:hypothetical protein